jgi:uncharacterized hydrophobic protein (TIGR00271 family)
MQEDKLAFLYGEGSEAVVAQVKADPYAEYLEFIMIEEFMLHPSSYTNNQKVIVSASIEEIKALLEIAEECTFSLAFIPQESQHALRESFHLSSSVQENLRLAMESEAKSIDLLVGAGRIVLYSAQVGDTPPLSYSTTTYEKKSLKERLVSFFDIFTKFKNLHHAKLILKTKKGQEITTVGSGVVVVEHDNHTFASRIVSESLRANDGLLSALLIAPTSLMGYMGFLFKALLLKPKKGTLPSGVGLVESARLEISSQPRMPVTIDGKEVGETPVIFEVREKALKVCLPKEFWENETSPADKETIKLGNLPTSKEAVNFQQAKLPLFSHASEEQYQSLFVSLREEAKASHTFMTLIFLSTLLATVGLYLNSASVIIGAMLLAPLMQPIVSFSMGVLRRNQSIFTESLKTIMIGLFIALISAALFALLMPFESLTNEMQGRLKPSILDLIVALISGMAAAYAKNNEKIVGSLVGVSIAVALVPPIAVAGIGLGWGDFDMFYHAFLLFLTNFAGIVFAASMLFLVQGFSPISGAKRGLIFSLIGAIIVAIPLYFSFKSIVADANVRSSLIGQHFKIEGTDVLIEDVQLSHQEERLHIQCDLIVTAHLSGSKKQMLKRMVEMRIGREVVIEAIERVRF